MSMRAHICRMMVLIASILSLCSFTIQDERNGTIITVSETGQAALAQPKIMFELRDAKTGAPLRKSQDDLTELLGEPQPLAFLDTGASSFIISKTTAERFGLRTDDAGRFVETGMSGDHAMEVSIPYTLALTHHPLAMTDDPGRDPRNPGRSDVLEFKAQRLLINRNVDELTQLLGVLGGAIDVVGMPAISEMMFEIQPQRADESSVPVRILTPRARLRAGVWIPLEMMEFSRRKHPDNRDPLPALARNPVIPRVKAAAGAMEADGDWLLDTGSAFTIISVKTAQAIGLFDAEGRPVRPADFQLPAGGISGQVHQLPGFQIDRVEFRGEGGTKVVFERPFVVVHDVSTTLDDGSIITLDGILGMNLLLNSGSEFKGTGFAEKHESVFESVIFDGPRARFGLARIKN